MYLKDGCSWLSVQTAIFFTPVLMTGVRTIVLQLSSNVAPVGGSTPTAPTFLEPRVRIKSTLAIVGSGLRSDLLGFSSFSSVGVVSYFSSSGGFTE